MHSEIKLILIVNGILVLAPLWVSVTSGGSSEEGFAKMFGGLGFILIGLVDLVLFIIFIVQKNKKTAITSLILFLVCFIVGIGVCSIGMS
jgi:hypothetical protein